MAQLIKAMPLILVSLVLAFLLISVKDKIPQIESAHWKIFSEMLKVEHALRPLPPSTKDIVLLTIDNKTLNHLPLRWPYPRSYFARVVDNLEKAGAGAIGFDFVFVGKSSPGDDLKLQASLDKTSNVVFATSIDTNGQLDLQSLSSLTGRVSSGVVTKMVDPDGVIRRNLTYLLSNQDPTQGFLSWEMQLLKQTKHIDLSTLSTEGNDVDFRNATGESWQVPVRPDTKTFLIHFRANSIDFPRVSFYDVFNGTFDPSSIRHKIVLIGTTSLVLQDIQLTAFGWLPGITLDANAFLALYDHDFLKPIPDGWGFFAAAAGVVISAFALWSYPRKKAYVFIGAMLLAFLVVSYVLLVSGYFWDYFLFPLTVVICPWLGEKLCILVRKKNDVKK